MRRTCGAVLYICVTGVQEIVENKPSRAAPPVTMSRPRWTPEPAPWTGNAARGARRQLRSPRPMKKCVVDHLTADEPRILTAHDVHLVLQDADRHGAGRPRQTAALAPSVGPRVVDVDASGRSVAASADGPDLAVVRDGPQMVAPHGKRRTRGPAVARSFVDQGPVGAADAPDDVEAPVEGHHRVSLTALGHPRERFPRQAWRRAPQRVGGRPVRRAGRAARDVHVLPETRRGRMVSWRGKRRRLRPLVSLDVVHVNSLRRPADPVQATGDDELPPDVCRSDFSSRGAHSGSTQPLTSLTHAWIGQAQDHDGDRERRQECCKDGGDDAQGEPNATPDHAGVL